MRIQPIKDRVLVKHVHTEASSILVAPDDCWGTFRKSIKPGTRDLVEVDAGLVRANVGRVVEINANTKLPLKKGDYILFRQGEAVETMSIGEARSMAEMYGEKLGVYYYVMPEAAIVAILPEGKPEDGVLR